VYRPFAYCITSNKPLNMYQKRGVTLRDNMRCPPTKKTDMFFIVSNCIKQTKYFVFFAFVDQITTAGCFFSLFCKVVYWVQYILIWSTDQLSNTLPSSCINSFNFWLTLVLKLSFLYTEYTVKVLSIHVDKSNIIKNEIAAFFEQPRLKLKHFLLLTNVDSCLFTFTFDLHDLYNPAIWLDNKIQACWT